MKAETTQGQYAAIRSSILAAVIDRAVSLGISVDTLLSKHGMSLDLLKDPYTQLAMNEYVSFLESAADLSQDEHFGARVGTNMRAGDLGPMGVLLSLSRTIHVGLSRLNRSVRALQTGTDLEMLESDDLVIWSYQLRDSRVWPRRQESEFSMTATTQVIRDNFGSRWSPMQVHFEHSAPADTKFLHQFFGCEVIFGQATNRLVMDRAQLLEVKRTEDAALILMLERHIDDLKQSTPRQTSLTAAVKSIVSSSLGLRPVSVERIADALGHSPRNLQRKLAEEGHNLRSIVDEIRQERARNLLADSRIPVGEIASSLGYSDGTAFWRAHRRWSQMKPTEVRAERRDD